MPLQRPEIDDVIAEARRLGIRLTQTEARIFTGRHHDHIAVMEAFLELRVAEHRPPLRHLERDPGYRPGPAEDPLNAFIRKCQIKGAASGPLAGRTVALKDHTAVAGVPMTLGSHFLDGYVPDFDASIVTRLLDAGAAIVGKMNMEDFSFGGPGISGVGDFGRPLNPNNHGHVTGGSSSGSGAAVAGGQVDIAFGGDQGGSIRIPAAWCGCVGLMATHGLIPHSGVFGLEASIDYVGPMTRNVEDLAAVLQVVAGADGYDPRQARVPAKLPDYVGALGQPAKGLKIGVLAEGFGAAGAEGDVEKAVRLALDALRGAGAELREVSVPLHRVAPQAIVPIYLEGARQLLDNNGAGAFGGSFCPASFMAAFGRAKRSHSHELPLNLKLMVVSGDYAHERLNGRLYAKALAVRPTVIAQYQQVFGQVDILAMPTVPMKALAYRTPTNPVEAIEHTLFGGELGVDLGPLIANTAPFNYTGFPALSLPCGKSQGLPIGLQLVAPHFREDLLIRAGHAYQRAAA
ncbi:MAG: amidase [Alphaproteobacteria bacterium]|nr:amidase [Alphaproteobacteria bacterium]